jgi:hypothetical protein
MEFRMVQYLVLCFSSKNQLSTTNSQSKLVLFADDTSIRSIIYRPESDYFLHFINDVFASLNKWLTAINKH